MRHKIPEDKKKIKMGAYIDPLLYNILEENLENQSEKIKEIEIQQDSINDNKSLEDKQELNHQEIEKLMEKPNEIEQNTEDNYKFDAYSSDYLAPFFYYKPSIIDKIKNKF